jgi:hypothetical protein
MTNTLTQERTEQQQNGTRTERRYLSPRVNIAETPDEYILEAEMPGVSRKGWKFCSSGTNSPWWDAAPRTSRQASVSTGNRARMITGGFLCSIR